MATPNPYRYRRPVPRTPRPTAAAWEAGIASVRAERDAAGYDPFARAEAADPSPGKREPVRRVVAPVLEDTEARLAQCAPLLGLAAVGQHIADIDADRAWDLARRNASQDRIQRWAVESARGALSLDDLEARAFHPLFPVRAALGLCVCEGPHGTDDARVCSLCGGEL